MPQERLTVRKIKEILRLKYEAKLSNRAIAGACNVSNSTVGEYLRRAGLAGIQWPLGEESEEELYEKLFPEKKVVVPERTTTMPNWEDVHKEKRKKGVSLQLLWQEYKAAYPQGYQYSQYCEHYRRWKKSRIEPSYRIDHIGGEQMQVDYAGLKIPITDPQTGKVSQASVFVAILPASNYIYAEAQPCENQCNWNNGHVRAMEFLWRCGQDCCAGQPKNRDYQTKLLRSGCQSWLTRNWQNITSLQCFLQGLGNQKIKARRKMVFKTWNTG